MAAVAVGKERFSDVDYSGIMWVEDVYDDDYLGFVFSYQDSSNFYVCYSPKDGNPGKVGHRQNQGTSQGWPKATSHCTPQAKEIHRERS